jgi:hypothetical protein
MAATSRFTPATRQKSKLRALFASPPGNGKSYTSLSVLTHLIAPSTSKELERKIAVICTENGRIQMYASGKPFHFSVLVLNDFSPEGYADAIDDAAREGFEALLVDSISDEWDWTLTEIDRLQTPESGKKLDKRGAWGVMTPRHNGFLRVLTRAPMHVAATCLMKPEYAMVDDPDRPGKKKMTRVGLALVQREGIERLFDIAGVMEEEAELYFTKTLCQSLYGRRYKTPGRELAQTIGAWLEEGEQVPETTEAMVKTLVDRASLSKEAFTEANDTMLRWCMVRGVEGAAVEHAKASLKALVKEKVVKAKEGADVKPGSTGAQASSPAETPAPTSAPAEQGAAATA